MTNQAILGNMALRWGASLHAIAGSYEDMAAVLLPNDAAVQQQRRTNAGGGGLRGFRDTPVATTTPRRRTRPSRGKTASSR